MKSTINQAARREVRKVAGAWRACEVRIVDGADAPSLRGESFHWETRGGRRVYHPNAYAKRGWSNLVYVCSTYRVEVGREWLISNGIEVAS